MAQRIRVGSVELNQGAMARVVGSIAWKATERAAETTRLRAQANLRGAGRINSGKMLDGIVKVDASSVQLKPTFSVVSTSPASVFQEHGTSAHGPVRARALRFSPKGSSQVVYAKWVRGVTAARFMRRAKDALQVGDFK